jgi:hypothetical protein
MGPEKIPAWETFAAFVLTHVNAKKANGILIKSRRIDASRHSSVCMQNAFSLDSCLNPSVAASH